LIKGLKDSDSNLVSKTSAKYSLEQDTSA